MQLAIEKSIAGKRDRHSLILRLLSQGLTPCTKNIMICHNSFIMKRHQPLIDKRKKISPTNSIKLERKKKGAPVHEISN